MYVPVQPLPGAGDPERPSPPAIEPGRPMELAALALMVVVLDITMYSAPGGMGSAVMLLGLSALALATAREKRFSSRAIVLGGLVVLAAARCAWQWSSAPLAVGCALALAFVIALRTPRSFVPELIVSAIGSAFGSFRELWNFGGSGIALSRPSRLAKVRWVALFVPLGLVALFGAVFAAANPVVANAFRTALGYLPNLSWFPSPLRFLFWGLSALAAAGLLRPVCRDLFGLDARLGPGEALPVTEDLATEPRLAVARNGMLALNVLFLGYNALDAVYLWAGRAPEGVSHTDYAHGGAAWLTVALVLSTLVLGALFRGPITSDPRGKVARALAYGWAAQNLVLAAGTFRRIAMYVSYSGLTNLRWVGIFGTALVTVGLVIIVMKVAQRRTMLWVVRRQLDALMLAIAIFVVMPTGWLSMRYNVSRIQDAQYRPLLHLFQQPITDEAIPALLPLAHHPDPIVAQGVAAILLHRLDHVPVDVDPSAWTQRQVAREHAMGELSASGWALLMSVPTSEAQVAARAKLRGLAYGINEEVEQEGDEAPFDWNGRRYPARY